MIYKQRWVKRLLRAKVIKKLVHHLGKINDIN
jgi:hypothetical protein